MERDVVLTLVLAVLAVLALAVAAATLTDAVTVGGEGSSLGGGAGDGLGGDEGSGSGQDRDSSFGSVSADLQVDLCVKWLTDPRVAGAILFGLLALAGAEWYMTNEPFAGFAVFVMVGLPVGFVYYLLTACGGGETRLGLGGRAAENFSFFPASGAGGGGSGAGDAAASTVSSPQIALLVVLGLAILVAVGLLFTGTGSDDPPAADDAGDHGPPEPDIAAVGRAAGDAADRIRDDADVENEVYRAWREMTTHLDVPNPHSATPKEFAEAAVDAGMAPDDVDELTDVFEAVRYGGYEPTPAREQRALAALRRIESAYAEGGATAGRDGSTTTEDDKSTATEGDGSTATEDDGSAATDDDGVGNR